MSQEDRINQNLKQIAETHFPSVDLRERIRARVNPEKALPWRMRLSPLVVIGIALLAIFAIAGTAYATSSGFRSLFQMDPRLQAIDPDQMGQKLDLAQTQDGVNVLLPWAYADSDRVLIGISLSTADGKRFDPSGLYLTDSAGNDYPFDFAYGVTGHSDLIGVDLPAGAGDYIYSFSKPAGIPESQELALTLRVEAEELIVKVQVPSIPTQQMEEGNIIDNETEVLEPLPVGQRVGPFDFHFTVKVSP